MRDRNYHELQCIKKIFKLTLRIATFFLQNFFTENMHNKKCDARFYKKTKKNKNFIYY